jgi:hypothetical protein
MEHKPIKKLTESDKAAIDKKISAKEKLVKDKKNINK